MLSKSAPTTMYACGGVAVSVHPAAAYVGAPGVVHALVTECTSSNVPMVIPFPESNGHTNSDGACCAEHSSAVMYASLNTFPARCQFTYPVLQ